VLKSYLKRKESQRRVSSLEVFSEIMKAKSN